MTAFLSISGLQQLCVAALCFGLVACGGDPAPTDQTTRTALAITGRSPYEFAQVEDNLQHDTLLIQTTFDLGDSTYIMVASNVSETFDGLRLYRYRFGADSTVQMMAISSPAYDSWTMLPTFFPIDTARPTDAMWVLANFGEKESWGQKLLWLDEDFTDMGFMEVALPERVMEDDQLTLKRRSIAQHMRFSERGDTTVFQFACDSVFLYDDQAGHMDQVLPGRAVHFTFHREEGLSLWVGGTKRSLRSPA